MPVEERFWVKVDRRQDEECWPWLASIHQDGYGAFWYEKRWIGAHRASYLLLVGEIADCMEVDHLCRNRACVNPSHLEVVDHAENTRRAAAAQDRCAHGHLYTPENTYRTNHGRGCKTCRVVPVPCPVCGAERSKTNISSHVKRKHPEVIS
jgi:hypothetical protein